MTRRVAKASMPTSSDSTTEGEKQNCLPRVKLPASCGTIPKRSEAVRCVTKPPAQVSPTASPDGKASSSADTAHGSESVRKIMEQINACSSPGPSFQSPGPSTENSREVKSCPNSVATPNNPDKSRSNRKRKTHSTACKTKEQMSHPERPSVFKKDAGITKPPTSAKTIPESTNFLVFKSPPQTPAPSSSGKAATSRDTPLNSDHSYCYPSLQTPGPSSSKIREQAGPSQSKQSTATLNNPNKKSENRNRTPAESNRERPSVGKNTQGISQPETSAKTAPKTPVSSSSSQESPGPSSSVSTQKGTEARRSIAKASRRRGDSKVQDTGPSEETIPKREPPSPSSNQSMNPEVTDPDFLKTDSHQSSAEPENRKRKADSSNHVETLIFVAFQTTHPFPEQIALTHHEKPSGFANELRDLIDNTNSFPKITEMTLLAVDCEDFEKFVHRMQWNMSNVGATESIRVSTPVNSHICFVKPPMTEEEWRTYGANNPKGPPRKTLSKKKSFNVEWKDAYAFVNRFNNPCFVAPDGISFNFRALYGGLKNYGMEIQEKVLIVDGTRAIHKLHDDQKKSLDSLLEGIDWTKATSNDQNAVEGRSRNHPLGILKTSDWSPAKLRRWTSECFKVNASGQYEMNDDHKQFKLPELYDEIIKEAEVVLENAPESEEHTKDAENLLQVCVAYGNEFLSYVNEYAAAFPFNGNT